MEDERVAGVKLGERWISLGGRGLWMLGRGVGRCRLDIVQELYGSVGTRRTKNGDNGRCVVLNDRAAVSAGSNVAVSSEVLQRER